MRFQWKQFQVAQNSSVSVEIVAIGSDFVHLDGLAQHITVSVEKVPNGSDFVHFS